MLRVREDRLAPDSLPDGLAAYRERFVAHLRSVRGLSLHTVRAYRGDVTTLLQYLADSGRDDLAALGTVEQVECDDAGGDCACETEQFAETEV